MFTKINDNGTQTTTLRDRGTMRNHRRTRREPVLRHNYLSDVEVTSMRNKIQPPRNRRTVTEPVLRKNFLQPAPAPRQNVDIHRLEELDILKHGQKVQIGDKTLDKIFSTQVPDPSDKAWLDEFQRRALNGESRANILRNPPFGRQQRTMIKKVSFADSLVNAGSAFLEIKSLLSQGLIETVAERKHIGGLMVTLLTKVENFEQLDRGEQKQMMSAIQRLGISEDYTQSFKKRFYNLEDYKKESGLVTLYLLAFVDKERFREDNPIKVVRLDEKKQERTTFVKLSTFRNNMGFRNNRNELVWWIDLKEREVITNDVYNKRLAFYIPPQNFNFAFDRDIDDGEADEEI